MTRSAPAALDAFAVSEAIVTRVLAEALARGGDFADLYFQSRRSCTIGMEDGLVSRASSSVDRGVGVRVVRGDQTGYAFSETLEPAAMLRAARTAASIATGSASVAPQEIVATSAHDLYAIVEPWDEVDVARRVPLLRRADALARAMDPTIEKVGLSLADTDEHVVVVTSEGTLLADRRPMTRMHCAITMVREGVVQSSMSNIAARRGIDWYDDERLRALCADAVARTAILFEARRPPAGEMPVVLAAGASGILLHEAVGHGMEADFNRKGVSIYARMIGRPVAPPCVTIVDSAMHPHERGSLNFDDEGSATEETVLVEDGIMRSYLHDRISARHYGVAPTGSGRRQSFRHSPMPRMRCTYMRPGTHSREEVIGAVKRGILAETFANGQVQIGGGDFTFYIKNGWMIEDGRLTAPIKDVNIIGNGPEALRRITMLADDMRMDTGGWTCGKDGQMVPVSQGMPTTLVSHLTVGGEAR
jgi:TldD protein